MAEQLKGITVALAGPRKAEDMARLVENMGEPRCNVPPREQPFWMMPHCVTG